MSMTQYLALVVDRRVGRSDPQLRFLEQLLNPALSGEGTPGSSIYRCRMTELSALRSLPTPTNQYGGQAGSRSELATRTLPTSQFIRPR